MCPSVNDKLSSNGMTQLDEDSVTLSVVIPSYNEVNTIEGLLRTLNCMALSLAVLVIDDGSTDGTRPLLKDLYKEELIDRLLLQDFNKGKGAAVILDNSKGKVKQPWGKGKNLVPDDKGKGKDESPSDSDAGSAVDPAERAHQAQEAREQRLACC